MANYFTHWRLLTAQFFIIAVVAAIGVGSTAASAGATEYGLADAQAETSNTTWWGDPYLQYLFKPLDSTNRPGYTGGGAQFKHVRLFANWDAVAHSTTKTGTAQCAWSNSYYYDGQRAYNRLLTGLQNIPSGADVMVSLVGADDTTAHNNVTDSGYGVGNVLPTENDLYCGLSYLMSYVTNAGHHVSAWEIYNEPDANSPFNPIVDAHGNSGAAAAADLYYDAWYARGAAGTADADDTLIAGAFSNEAIGPNCCGLGSFALTYLNQLASYYNAGYTGPLVLSGHPYDDATSDGAWGAAHGGSEMANLAAVSSTVGLGSLDLWATETGDWLDDANYPSTDNNATAQGSAASYFISGYSGMTRVKRVYWYEYGKTTNKWDSGLVDPNGHGRASYCVVYGVSTTNCTTGASAGDPTDSADPNLTDPNDPTHH